MYIIGVIVFVVCMMLLMAFDAMSFADFPSLVVIILLSFPILMASGLLPDFFKGFKLMSKKVNPYSMIELKRILQAYKLAIRCFLLSGAVGTLTGMIMILSRVTDPKEMAPSAAVALLTTLYSWIIVFMVLPIQAKVMAIIDTME